MTTAEKLDQFVAEVLGNDALDKLNNQHRGGSSNSKGNRHEERFAVYKIAKHYGEAKNDADRITVGTQEKAFVDDFVLKNEVTGEKKSYQLKDAQSVYWGGENGIAPYFEHQNKVDTELYKLCDAKTVLVLANWDVYDKRRADIPAHIEKHTSCLHFGNPESINALLMENDEFRGAITQLCTSSEPDKLTVVIQNLLGAWKLLCTSYPVSVKDVIDRARDGARPDFFKHEDDQDLDIDDELKAALDKVDGLGYQVRDGYLNYWFRDGMFSGIVKPRLRDSRFIAIREEIIDKQPRTIFDLAKLLMSTGEQA